MKYLKTKNISKFSIADRSFIVEQPSGKITTNSQDSIKIPTGALERRPVVPDQGMIRFTSDDTSNHEDVNVENYFPSRPIGIEAYFDGEWRPIRLQGPAEITKTLLGTGNWDAILQPNEDLSRFFPSSGEPLDIIPNSGDSVIVLVENVFQIHGAGNNFQLIESDGEVVAAEILNGGSGYTSATVTFDAPLTLGGTTAEGVVVIESGEVVGITITNTGSGYTSAPSMLIVGDGSNASASSVITKPGWHIEFFSAVPDTKKVYIYHGFDQ
jgi:hypothetical protein